MHLASSPYNIFLLSKYKWSKWLNIGLLLLLVFILTSTSYTNTQKIDLQQVRSWGFRRGVPTDTDIF